MKPELVPALEFPQEVASLFSEYTELLIAGDAFFREYLAIQNYDAELCHLETKYGPPAGRLYLAMADDAAAGCIGLKKIDEKRCEMKRLYVRPAFRGMRISELLIDRIIADARDIGYSHMLLDTLPFLKSAIRIYRRYGFYEIPCYNDSPMDSSIYMQLDL